MRRYIGIIAIIVVTKAAVSQTMVSGNQSGVWTAAGSPYIVNGEIIVPAGETLEIQSGVEVNFQGHYKFTVNGELQALGTETDSIYFTTDIPATGWGGIRIESDEICSLSYCRIEFGKTMGEYPDIHGGGLALLSSNASVSNCVFADNDATGSDNGSGGAVYAYNTGSPSETLTTFTDCIFTGNHAYGEGGAIQFTGDINSELTGCLFLDNDCQYGGGAVSGYTISGTEFTRCLFADNSTAYSNGGAIHTLGMGNTLYLINCTFSSNSAVAGDGGAIDLAYAAGYFVNTIIYDNPGMYSNDLFLDMSGSAEVYYCDVQLPPGATGANNFYEDPQFTDPGSQDFSLLPTSICIDTGIAFFVLDGDTLVDMDPEEYFGPAPDVGAFEFNDGSGVTNNQETGQTVIRLSQNSPNPFNTSTSISYDLYENSYVSVIVYDLYGRVIKTLVKGEETAGSRSVVWNGRSSDELEVPAGTYIIRLHAGTVTESVKTVVIR